MQETPKDILAYTELKNGKRHLKKDAPDEIKKKAVEWERNFYHLTARRRIINVNID